MDSGVMLYAVVNHEFSRQIPDILDITKIYLKQHYVLAPKEIKCCENDTILCYHSYETNTLVCVRCQKIFCTLCFQ